MSIANELAANRRAAARERATWAVYPLTNAGQMYKRPIALANSEAEARRKASDLRELNPGRSYVVRPIN